jgi:hypothetical protein
LARGHSSYGFPETGTEARPTGHMLPAPPGTERIAKPPARALAEQTAAQPVAHSVPGFKEKQARVKRENRFFETWI